jgi:hypothetical protein
MIGLKKKTKATKCSDHRTISLISHTAKIIAKVLKRRIERKFDDILGEDQFGFRRGKGTRDAIGMMSFEMWRWRRMEKISWTDHVRNEEVLLRVSEQRNILHEENGRQLDWSHLK